MGGLYARLAKTGNRLLAKYGKDIPITRVVNGAYNAVAGTVAQTTTSYVVKGQAFNYSDRSIAQAGGLIRVGDRKLIISAVGLSFIPDPTTDTVTLDGQAWGIVRTDQPVDEPVIYELQLRRAN